MQHGVQAPACRVMPRLACVLEVCMRTCDYSTASRRARCGSLVWTQAVAALMGERLGGARYGTRYGMTCRRVGKKGGDGVNWCEFGERLQPEVALRPGRRE